MPEQHLTSMRHCDLCNKRLRVLVKQDHNSSFLVLARHKCRNGQRIHGQWKKPDY